MFYAVPLALLPQCPCVVFGLPPLALARPSAVWALQCVPGPGRVLMEGSARENCTLTTNSSLFGSEKMQLMLYHADPCSKCTCSLGWCYARGHNKINSRNHCSLFLLRHTVCVLCILRITVGFVEPLAVCPEKSECVRSSSPGVVGTAKVCTNLFILSLSDSRAPSKNSCTLTPPFPSRSIKSKSPSTPFRLSCSAGPSSAIKSRHPSVHSSRVT